MYSFQIYVTGETVRSRQAVSNLKRLCESTIGDAYNVEVVDVLKQPSLAEELRIIATPTVVRLSPPPPRRVIGDLSNFGLATIALDL